MTQDADQQVTAAFTRVATKLQALESALIQLSGYLDLAASSITLFTGQVMKTMADLTAEIANLKSIETAWRAKEAALIAALQQSNTDKDAAIAASTAASTALQAKVDDLQKQVDAGTNPDTTDLITSLQAIEGDLSDATPDPTPTPVPDPTPPGETPVTPGA